MNIFKAIMSLFTSKPQEAPKNESFSEWFARQNIRNFKSHEFENYFNAVRKGVKNSEPPRELWANIVEPLRIVDDARDVLKSPITILSSYRSPAYNTAVKGARFSRHKEFDALDITTFKHATAHELYKLLLKWRDEGRFRGGLHYYPESNFVHIDTRGENANW